VKQGQGWTLRWTVPTKGRTSWGPIERLELLAVLECAGVVGACQ
jgi:hypothetical protein